MAIPGKKQEKKKVGFVVNTELQQTLESLSKDDPNGLNFLRTLYQGCKNYEKGKRKKDKDNMFLFKMTLADFMLELYPNGLNPFELREFLSFSPHNEGVFPESEKQVTKIKERAAREFLRSKNAGLRMPDVIEKIKNLALLSEDEGFRRLASSF